MYIPARITLALLFVAYVSSECANKRKDCNNMRSLCSVHTAWLKKVCPVTCGLCGDGVTTVKPTDGPWTKVPTNGPVTKGPTDGPVTPGACGMPQISHGRVIAGKTAVRGSWPWQILLTKSNRPSCGGTLISPTWVVTAAHCVHRSESRTFQFKIRVGEFDRRDKYEGSEEDFDVSLIITNPNYVPKTMSGDIALIKLSKPVKFNKYVQPACLPAAEIPTGSECYITGWGKTSHPGSMTTILQQGKMKIVDRDICYQQNRRYIPFSINRYMVCAGDGGETRLSGCHGDSGGPFVCKVGGRWEIHGAVSHGSNDCKSSKTYTVFANVHIFKQWIQKTMSRH